MRLTGTAGTLAAHACRIQARPDPERGGLRVQLCAQALCLEAALGVEIAVGAIYFGENRRRMDVTFDTALRAETERAAA